MLAESGNIAIGTFSRWARGTLWAALFLAAMGAPALAQIALPEDIRHDLRTASADHRQLVGTARRLMAGNPNLRAAIALEVLALSVERQVASDPAHAGRYMAQAMAAAQRRGLVNTVSRRERFSERLRRAAAAPTVARQSNTDKPSGGLDLGGWTAKPWYPAALLAGGLAIGGATIAIADDTDANESEAAQTPPTQRAPAPPTRVIVRPAPPPPQEPESFEGVDEDRRQAGLAQINALPGETSGNTGAGVRVAVADSGIDLDHPDLEGALVPGTDLLGGDEDPSPLGQGSFRSHGTNVAGIIAARDNDFGIRGVAPGARVVPVRVGDSAGQVFLNEAEYVDALIARGVDIVNNSFGSGGDAASFTEAQIGAFERGVNEGLIFVWSAGNDAQPQPSAESLLPSQSDALRAGWVSVVAVDEDNNLASFSNQCGAAAAWCLAAPGTTVTTTADGDDDGFETLFGSVSGTSFAAPHVAGALAVLKENFPSMSNAELLEVMFTSATPLGETPPSDAPPPENGDENGGNEVDPDMEMALSPVFGHGLLNLEAALQPQGMLVAATGAAVDGPSASLDGATLTGGAAFGDAVAAQGDGGFVLGLDVANKPFFVPLAALMHDGAPALQAAERLYDFGHRVQLSEPMPLGDLGQVRVNIETRRQLLDTNRDRRGLVGSTVGVAGLAEEPLHRFNIRAQLHGFGTFSIRFGQDAGALASDNNAFMLFDPSALANPYLRFGGEDMAVHWRGGRWSALATIDKISARHRHHPFAARGDTGRRVGVSVGRQFGSATPQGAWLRLLAGALIEQNSVLGLRGAGALSLSGTGRTAFTGARAQVPVRRWSNRGGIWLVGNAYAGLSQLHGGGALIESVSAVRSGALTLGLTGTGLAGRHDRWHALVSRPLRVERGAMKLRLPWRRSVGGRVFFRDQRLDLSPNGAALNVEAGYSVATGPGGRITAAVSMRQQPGHRRDIGLEASGLMRLQHRF